MGFATKRRARSYSAKFRDPQELLMALGLETLTTATRRPNSARSVACETTPRLLDMPDISRAPRPLGAWAPPQPSPPPQEIVSAPLSVPEEGSGPLVPSKEDVYEMALRAFREQFPTRVKRWWRSLFRPELGTLASTLPRVDWLGDDVYSIEKDVDRTFPSSPFFASLHGVERIRRIAAAYAQRNPSVGYCQGMNFLSGYLLMALETFFPNKQPEEIEDQAFSWLACIVESEVYHHVYFDKDDAMVHLKTDFLVLEKLLEDCLPEVAEHIQTFSATTPIVMYVASKWFICLFIDCLKPDLLVHVWDMYLQQGIVVVFWISLLVFHQCKEAILQARDIDIITAISRGAKELPVRCLEGRLLQSMQAVVTHGRIQQLREEVRSATGPLQQLRPMMLRSCDFGMDLCCVM
eukprot:GGOE01045430.1.p1 GENE.GGOE01045430.1~~GGOE01045430.1.p1  ORF type:complete len:407 (-),score=149.10 GGOE01045430.1:442-1662(-)